MVSSGQTNWSLSNAEVLLEAFDRCEMRPDSLTGEHMQSARRSLNLELQHWGNYGINLWEVDLQTISLVQGVTVYNIPSDTITMLDTYLRLVQLPTIFNASVAFSTTIASNQVTITISNSGLLTGYWINIITPVSVGGIVLQGFYQVTQALSNDNFVITAASLATAMVTNGGLLPLFTTFANSPNITVTLANHGLLTGQQFIVGAPTTVGGVTISGGYTITSVIDSANFTISAAQNAFEATTAYENAGNVQIQAQNATVQPTDRVMTPIGRTDWAVISDKTVQGYPTVYWYDRNINQTVTIWQPPDQNGPYVLYYYRMKRIQTANPTMGETPDVPYLFYEALCARMAARMAVKYAKAMLPILQPLAEKAMQEAMDENRERADIYIQPMIAQYWNP